MQIKKEHAEKSLQFIQRLSDIRFAGQVLFVVLVLLISWSGIKTIQTNYGLQKQISALKQKTEVQKLENNNLKLQNDYYHSSQYLELEARQSFGLAAAGETEVLVPKNVALAYTVDLPKNDSAEATSKPPGYQRNFESWVNFFLHRQNTQD